MKSACLQPISSLLLRPCWQRSRQEPGRLPSPATRELFAARAGTGGRALQKGKPTFHCSNKSACICYQAGGWWSTDQRTIEILLGEKEESLVKGYFSVSMQQIHRSQPPGLLWPQVPAMGLKAF